MHIELDVKIGISDCNSKFQFGERITESFGNVSAEGTNLEDEPNACGLE